MQLNLINSKKLFSGLLQLRTADFASACTADFVSAWIADLVGAWMAD